MFIFYEFLCGGLITVLNENFLSLAVVNNIKPFYIQTGAEKGEKKSEP
jgi:hypothetical protein